MRTNILCQSERVSDSDISRRTLTIVHNRGAPEKYILNSAVVGRLPVAQFVRKKKPVRHQPRPSCIHEGLGRRLGRRQRTSVIASQPDRRNLGRRRPASPRQPPRRRAAFFRRQSLRRQLSGAASISSLVFSRSQPPRPFASSSPSIAYSRRQRPLTASASSSPPSPVFAPACSVQPVASVVSWRTGCSALLSLSAG